MIFAKDEANKSKSSQDPKAILRKYEFKLGSKDSVTQKRWNPDVGSIGVSNFLKFLVGKA
jgi:hypothetical protein